jgi:lipopolysaccharide transport system ATP-binding protein
VSAIAVRTEGLSKRYHLKELDRALSLKAAVTDAMAARLRGAAARAAGTGGKAGGGWIWALRDVSLEVPRGEVLGIIGRNGAGKSTLMRVLSRITYPTAGWAEIHGRVGALIGVGTGFHPELSGRENVYLNGAILGMRKADIDRRFEQIVAFAELERFIDVPVKRYSTGMYTRLAFAVAAHVEPDVLIVDEVLAVGDAAFQRKSLGVMENMARDGRTVLFVSHNLPAVQSLCRRAVWLDEGRVVAEGNSRDVAGKYLQKILVPVTERVWEGAEAPGRDGFRLRRASVHPIPGSPRDPITLDTPIAIEIEYHNLHAGMRIPRSLNLINQHGVVLFRAAPAGAEGRPDEPLPAGLLRDTCRIPGKLLNSGVHRVELVVGSNHTAADFRREDVLVFEVVDAEAAGTWTRSHGAVRPQLAWSTELVEEDAPCT